MSNALAMTEFESEVILPAQVPWGARYDGNTSGPRALMLAILEDALLCIERGRRRRHPRTRRLAAEAETWIRSECREWLFSFASICDVLGFDADALRVRLLANVKHPASGGPAVRAEANAPSPRGAACAQLPQREGTPERIAVDAARAQARHSSSGRETGAGFAQVGLSGNVEALPQYGARRQRRSRPLASAGSSLAAVRGLAPPCDGTGAAGWQAEKDPTARSHAQRVTAVGRTTWPIAPRM
jgi:hypothetical protein